MEQTTTNRWIEISQTSPSGKMMFVCRSCGRVSVTPDKECPKGIDVHQEGTIFKMACSLWPMNPSEWVEMDIAKKMEGKEAYFVGIVYLPDGPLRVAAPINLELARQLGCYSVEYQIREASRRANPQEMRKERKSTLERIKEQTATNQRDLEGQDTLKKLLELEEQKSKLPEPADISELYRKYGPRG